MISCRGREGRRGRGGGEEGGERGENKGEKEKNLVKNMTRAQGKFSKCSMCLSRRSS